MSSKDFAHDVNHNVAEYIRFADAKAGAVIGVLTVVCGVVGVAFHDLLDAGLHPLALAVATPLLGAITLFSAVSVWRAIDVLLPNTVSAESLASFPDIAEAAKDVYPAAIVALDDAAIAREYARHTWALATIAKAKFAAISSSVKWLRVSLLVSLAFLAFYGLARAIAACHGGL